MTKQQAEQLVEQDPVRYKIVTTGHYSYMRKYLGTYFKYRMQLSMYKWLNPELNLNPWGDIIFSLNDGGGMERYAIDNYHRFPLFLDEEIEEFVKDKIAQMKAFLLSGEMPLCSDQDRGFQPGSWKLQRVSKTNGKPTTVRGSIFNNEPDFREFVRTKGKPGDIELITEPKYNLCNYCQFSSICDQE